MISIRDISEDTGFSAAKIYENVYIYIALGNTNNLHQKDHPIALLRLQLYDVEIITSDGSFIHLIKESNLERKDIDKIINRALRLVVKKGKLLDVFNNIYEMGFENGQKQYAKYTSQTLEKLLNPNIL